MTSRNDSWTKVGPRASQGAPNGPKGIQREPRGVPKRAIDRERRERERERERDRERWIKYGWLRTKNDK